MARSRRRFRRRPAYLMYEDRFVVNQTEAARILGISQRTLAALRRRYQGPPYSHVGPHIRYCLTDLLDFMEAQQSAHKPAAQNDES